MALRNTHNTDFDFDARVRDVLDRPLDFPLELKLWIKRYLEINPPGLPFDVLTGKVSLLQIDRAGAAIGDLIQWNGSKWVPAAGGGGGGAPTTSQYVTLAADAGLANERILTAGEGLVSTDGGAGGALTLDSEAVMLDFIL